MTSRTRHRASLMLDLDVLHVGLIATLACVLSAGLVYLGYFWHVVQVARRSRCQPRHRNALLLFGKHAPGGHIDADFSARIQRVITLWPEYRPERLFLLGGGAAGDLTEAEIAHAALARHIHIHPQALHLERQSRDTLQNLRNARSLLADTPHQGPVTLLSSRYHLARCALFARQLGLEAELCAAETRLQWSLLTLWRLLGEAGYVCMLDLGTRWARLIGSQRMLARVT
ncbi:hypothetical protein CO614_06850 [Lysobacteraceae bacterium NML120232]|nr:hypothetical protein CO608_07555 [Xanthomonadaceae bacterium NML08-0793]PJK11670.1 hypothetical protein CO614_06850 [Xanthomonadaceae bacterium NML120232]